ncbi:MAG TPA: site-specific DNA-methyltransferase [Bacteroidia bacterium]|nr:site-specific DNA-methyltransferase [Bacteroidia bacterium]
MEVNKIYHDDWMNNQLPDKSVQLIIADPPYFEVKGAFDFVWNSFDDYLKDVEKWAIECKRLLADNGTLFWYGHAKKIAYTQLILDKYFNLENVIKWRKTDCQTRKGYNVYRCFPPVTEHILFYSNLPDRSPFAELINKRMQDLNLKEKDFRKLRPSKNGIPTGWMSNIMLGKNMPKKEDWELIETLIQSGIEFEPLMEEYEVNRRTFNNINQFEDVWDLAQDVHITGDYEHPTMKTEKLARQMILCCSKEKDLVLIPFAGSGTECAMSAKENRNFIGFEIDAKHFKTATDRTEIIKSQPSLFF